MIHQYVGIGEPCNPRPIQTRDASGVLKLKLVFIVQLTHRCYFGTETGLDMSSWTTLICNSNIPSNFYSYYYHYVILSFYLFSHLLNYRLFLISSRQILKQTTTRLPQKMHLYACFLKCSQWSFFRGPNIFKIRKIYKFTFYFWMIIMMIKKMTK